MVPYILQAKFMEYLESTMEATRIWYLYFQEMVWHQPQSTIVTLMQRSHFVHVMDEKSNLYCSKSKIQNGFYMNVSFFNILNAVIRLSIFILQEILWRVCEIILKGIVNCSVPNSNTIQHITLIKVTSVNAMLPPRQPYWPYLNTHACCTERVNPTLGIVVL